VKRVTKRGRLRRERQATGPGRRKVPAPEATRICARLRQFVREHYGTLYELREVIGLPKSTMQGWTRSKGPQTPDTATLLVLAREARLSLNWLLLGEGPERRGALLTDVELHDALRRTLIADLLGGGANELMVERVVPAGRTLYRRIVQDYARLLKRLTMDVGMRVLLGPPLKKSAPATRKARRIMPLRDALRGAFPP